MSISVTPNTQVILLLTAPLIIDGIGQSEDLLTPREYRRLSRLLAEKEMQAADLLDNHPDKIAGEVKSPVEPDRLKRLLDRRPKLAQALEHWQAISLWVVSPEDDEYPQRITTRLKDHAPHLIYGCGDFGLLETGGLAVVGSRVVDPILIEYTESVARLGATAECTIVSGDPAASIRRRCAAHCPVVVNRSECWLTVWRKAHQS